MDYVFISGPTFYPYRRGVYLGRGNKCFFELIDKVCVCLLFFFFFFFPMGEQQTYL